MDIIQTTYDGSRKNTTVSQAAFMPDGERQECNIINLYPTEKFQEWMGFGGAFTEAAGYVFASCPASMQEEMLDAYFGPTGLGYSIGRGAMDSCDFALGNYSAVNDPDDTELHSFSLARDEEYILPLIDRAKSCAPDMKIMLSPWSPPAFMKSNGQKNGGGQLLPEYYSRWARYMCQYVLAYRNRGIPIFALSVQNEPNAVQTWDSCEYSPEQERTFVRDFLGPHMKESGVSDVLLTIWDHNKERLFDRVDDICSDQKANDAVGACGFHWYSGDHFEGISLVSRKYPDKKLIFTEGCIEYSKFSADSQLHNAQMYAHEIIGSMNAGMHAFIDWNLYLDMSGGPNHVKNYCDAPIMADAKNEHVRYNLSYEYIGHFSRYIRPNAYRIGVTRYTDLLEATAFCNPDGSLATVILNRTEKEHNVFLRLRGRICPIRISPGSISTILIHHEE